MLEGVARSAWFRSLRNLGLSLRKRCGIGTPKGFPASRRSAGSSLNAGVEERACIAKRFGRIVVRQTESRNQARRAARSVAERAPMGKCQPATQRRSMDKKEFFGKLEEVVGRPAGSIADADRLGDLEGWDSIAALFGHRAARQTLRRGARGRRSGEQSDRGRSLPIRRERFPMTFNPLHLAGRTVLARVCRTADYKETCRINVVAGTTSGRPDGAGSRFGGGLFDLPRGGFRTMDCGELLGR